MSKLNAFRRPAKPRSLADSKIHPESPWPAPPPPRPQSNLGLRGNQFERAVQNSCETYARRGHGCIIKVPVPFRQVGQCDEGTHINRPIIARERATIDFIGHLFGVPTAIECKSVADDRLTIESGTGPKRRVFVHEHQLRFLDEFQRTSIPRLAAAFLLVEFRGVPVPGKEFLTGAVLAISPEVYRAAVKGRKSIGYLELKTVSHEVPVMTCGIAVHFASYIDHVIKKQGRG